MISITVCTGIILLRHGLGKLQADYEAGKKRLQQIEARTIDNFRIGEMQPERDHHLKAS